MGRPYVSLESKNEITNFIHHLESILPRLTSFPGVIGITLNGGLSRGYADHLSEIDITFYLENETYNVWKTNKAPIPLGIVKFDEFLYDVKILNFSEEEDRQYCYVELWDLSYAKILFDQENKVADLMTKKLATKPLLEDCHDFLWEAYWNYKLAGDIWINRGDELQGHFTFNEAIKPLIKALFVANEEHVPHEKWLVHFSRTLNWKPHMWEDRLTKAMSINNSLKERQKTISDLSEEIDFFVKEKYYPNYHLACHQKFFYDLLTFLVEENTISIEEWKKIANVSLLNMEPLHTITSIIDDKIELDKNKLLSIKPEDLYCWHYQIVESMQEKVKIKGEI